VERGSANAGTLLARVGAIVTSCRIGKGLGYGRCAWLARAAIELIEEALIQLVDRSIEGDLAIA
jgi:hypothetical protein